MRDYKEFNFVVKITTNCPANCKCCTNRKREFRLKNENNKTFDISIYEKICKNIKKIGGKYVCLSGGEPTIVPNLGEYFKIAQDNGLDVWINTNGWNITEENLTTWLSLGLKQVVLSMYGISEETVKNVRGSRLLYGKSIKAVTALKKSKERNNFRFIIQTVIMRQNYKEMPELLEFAIKNNADIFWLSYLEDILNLPEVRMEKADVKIFKNEIIPKMKEIIEKYVHKTELKERLQNFLDKYYENEFDGYIYMGDKKFHCHWLGRHLTFYTNGTVYPCPPHEYFSSKGQHKVDYSLIDDFLTLDNLKKNINSYSEHCKYCPHMLYSDEIIINENSR
jgi:MoaA/NifB/PqqE/SkfB family radical SAM enzyme